MIINNLILLININNDFFKQHIPLFLEDTNDKA